MGARGIAAAAVAVLLALALAAPAGAAEWLAGDGHVHTCYSHDAWCGPGDEEGMDAFYSFGGTVSERFAEGALKGLDFLVISDHEDIRAHTDPGFGSSGVTGIHAYEASLRGHAQMIGARRLYPEGGGDAPATTAMADALRADGGVFQANHPGYRLTGQPIGSCAEAGTSERMNWRYGYTVLPDTIEVWNATSLLRPAEYFWECWLQRGARIGALGGSDSHGANHVNLGIPMTWALAASPSEADVLAAIRGGRTTLSRLPSNLGGVRLVIEGDRDRDGSFESRIGDTVPPRTPLRVRTDGTMPGTGLLSVRANGRPARSDGPLAPGAEVRLEAPAEPGWVRATLYMQDGVSGIDPSCAPPESPPLSTCSEDLAVAAMTSPIYVSEPVRPGDPPGEEPPPPPPPKVDPPGEEPPPPGQPGSQPEEPDRQPPLPPSAEGGYQPMPDVPPQGERPPPVSKLRATWFRAAAARHRSLRVRLRWKASQGPFDVQLRRPGARKWRKVGRRTQSRQQIVRLARGKWIVRVRAVPAFAPAGPWRSLTIRL
ncbi:MAG TPA: CehA/McbA family metallohydrolase [Thermoleophilaceae bacterium]